jgi:RNase H-like domain found in reverse transcriptase
VLTTQPVLTLHEASKEHVIMTDAADHFIDGVLMQREDDGNLHL